MKHQTAKPSKTFSERGNSHLDFTGKNDEPRKILDKLTIYFFWNRISYEFFDGKP